MCSLVLIGESRAEKLLSGYPIVKARDYATVDSENAVVILGKNARCKINSALSVIVDGDEPFDSLPRDVQLISCGVSPKNTVSITSRTPEKLTLSLNRSIRTASGICEPLELPVKALESVSEYDIMAAFAANLLLK